MVLFTRRDLLYVFFEILGFVAPSYCTFMLVCVSLCYPMTFLYKLVSFM